MTHAVLSERFPLIPSSLAGGSAVRPRPQAVIQLLLLLVELLQFLELFPAQRLTVPVMRGNALQENGSEYGKDSLSDALETRCHSQRKDRRLQVIGKWEGSEKRGMEGPLPPKAPFKSHPLFVGSDTGLPWQLTCSSN